MVSLDFAHIFLGTFGVGTLGLPKKFRHPRNFQGTQVPPNIACFRTKKVPNFKLLKKKEEITKSSRKSFTKVRSLTTFRGAWIVV